MKLQLLIAATLSIVSGLAHSKAPEKPNILWLISEDNSKHYLKLYDENGAKMPNIERLASQGLTFNNAFSNAPVCSTARTTLASGIYGVKLGTYQHRGFENVSLPEGFKTFNQSLQEAGYYTSNNSKTDYNFVENVELWNESSKKATWRNKKPDQPFFHVQTFMVTHEGKLHFKQSTIDSVATKHDPKKVTLAPIYPDTPTFRYTMAKTLDNHKAADNQMGSVLKKLEEDGELENTFIFYFGDHGGVLPGSKGYLFERGLNVPLVVRVPENFKHLVGEGLRKNDVRVDGFVSFIDFAPTMLKLAGLTAEKEMDGESFLAPDLSLSKLNKRDTTFSHADRFDEKSDLVRSIRVGNYKYIRHYQPFYSDSLYAYFRYRQLAFKEWKDLHQQGKLNAIQGSFFEPAGVESLYDIDADPYETVDLAGDTKHHAKLLELRNQLKQTVSDMPDLGFIPESIWLKESRGKAFEFGTQQKARIAELINIADMQLEPFSQVESKLLSYLTKGNVEQQQWALITLSSFTKDAKHLTPTVEKLLASSVNSLVKGRAIEFLTLQHSISAVTPLSDVIEAENNLLVKVELLNIAAFIHEYTGDVFPVPKQFKMKKPSRDSATFKIDTWMYERWLFISKKSS
ncbi:sulfatase [Colwelliaceae bacterium BS250]